MKKLSLLAAALICSAVTFAQTATPPTPTPVSPVPAQMKDLRHDERDIRNDKATEAKDVKTGNITGAQAAKLLSGLIGSGPEILGVGHYNRTQAVDRHDGAHRHAVARDIGS